MFGVVKLWKIASFRPVELQEKSHEGVRNILPGITLVFGFPTASTRSRPRFNVETQARLRGIGDDTNTREEKERKSTRKLL
jgi:hypothetical protein